MRRLSTHHRLVTLTGPGGTGKTSLSREVAASLAREGHSAWLVPLADVLDPDLVPLAIARSLGLQTGSADPLAQAVALLSGRPTLLVLDNCEHLTEAAGTAIVTLLEHCPDLRVITTSRHSLGVPGEALWPVPPLALPTDLPEEGPHSLECLQESPAVQLFVERARWAQPDFTLTERNAAAVARLCVALEGVPLAIELAAARVRVLTPQAMLDRLTDRYGLLNRGFQGVPPRQQSLAASVGWSFDLCTPSERTLWTRLSVFVGGFDLDAAEAVCSGDGIERAEVLDLLASLLDKSIITRDPDDVAVHYRMLETIRQYGAGLLRLTSEDAPYRERHRAWFLDHAERLGLAWTSAEQRELLAWLERNHPNLRVAFETGSTRAAEAPAVLRGVVALEGYWVTSGLLSEARRWLAQAVRHAPEDIAVPDLANALWLTAYFSAIQMDLDEARACIEAAQSLASASDELVVHGFFQFALGIVAMLSGDLPAAVAALRRSSELLQLSHHRLDHGSATASYGICLVYSGDLAEAETVLRSLLARLPDGECYARSYALWALSEAALARDDLDAGERLARESLALKAKLRDQLGTALMLESLAAVAAARGRTMHSAELLGAAGSLWRFIGDSALSAPYISGQRELGERLARGSLDDAAFSEGYRRGSALSLTDAIDLALGPHVPDPVVGPAPVDPDEPTLTRREEEVAALLAEGLSNQEIADRLVISLRTAQGHVENLLRKLGVHSRTQVATWVLRRDARRRG